MTSINCAKCGVLYDAIGSPVWGLCYACATIARTAPHPDSYGGCVTTDMLNKKTDSEAAAQKERDRREFARVTNPMLKAFDGDFASRDPMGWCPRCGQIQAGQRGLCAVCLSIKCRPVPTGPNPVPTIEYHMLDTEFRIVAPVGSQLRTEEAKSYLNMWMHTRSQP